MRGDGPGPELARALLAGAWVVDDLAGVPTGFAGTAVTRDGRAWSPATRELRQEAQGGAERVLAVRNERDELIRASEAAVRAERAALGAVEDVRAAVAAADLACDEAATAARDAARAAAGREEERQVRVARRPPARRARATGRAPSAAPRSKASSPPSAATPSAPPRERAERAARIERLEAAVRRDRALAPATERLAAALGSALGAVRNRVEAVEAELAADRPGRAGGRRPPARVRRAGGRPAAPPARRRGRPSRAPRSARSPCATARPRPSRSSPAWPSGSGSTPSPPPSRCREETRTSSGAASSASSGAASSSGRSTPWPSRSTTRPSRTSRSSRASATDLETALRELRTLIRDTDRQIRETFEATFTAAAKNFEELAAHCFPGGRGRLRLVRGDGGGPRAVLGGGAAGDDPAAQEAAEEAAEAEAQAEGDGGPEDDIGVEIEITPAGKAMKRLTLLSGGEKSMTAIAFLFAVFLARPCPFYILDEVEAALDDLNITRFLDLVRTYRDRAQFIVVTHQKRTMEAADTLYGVSMGDDGVSKVVSRRLPPELVDEAEAAAAGAA